MYLIIGRYQGNTEEIDSAETMETARYLQREYQMAYGAGWIVTIKKAKP